MDTHESSVAKHQPRLCSGTVSERALRTILVAVAALHLALAIWLFFSPHSFFKTIGPFGPYNRHYERDVATFYLALGAGAAVATRRASWRVPVLAILTLQYIVHAVNHVIDVNRSHNAWAGPFDVVTLGLGGLQLAGFLWLLRRREEPAA
ncbi:MAG: hypothetical protein NVSMB25_19550 [Thermoleophilaceae bacterium]